MVHESWWPLAHLSLLPEDLDGPTCRGQPASQHLPTNPPPPEALFIPGVPEVTSTGLLSLIQECDAFTALSIITGYPS